MAEPTIQTTIQPLLRRSPERESLERRARMLARGGIAYDFVEFAIAIGAGIAASSIALIGFGADSLIEALAGFARPRALHRQPDWFSRRRAPSSMKPDTASYMLKQLKERGVIVVGSKHSKGRWVVFYVRAS